MINSGGAVGAADLLQAPHEIIKLDLAMPMSQLAQQVHTYQLLFLRSDFGIFRAVTSLCTFAASLPTTHPAQSLDFLASKRAPQQVRSSPSIQGLCISSVYSSSVEMRHSTCFLADGKAG